MNSETQIRDSLADGLKRWVQYSKFYDADVRPYRNSADLTNLGVEQCKEAAERINAYLKIFDSADPEVIRRRDEPQLLRLALKHLNLRPADDRVFSMLGEGDIIEIYDSNFVQLYRNLVFMKYCSYDLISLVTNSHADLYSVPAEDYKVLYEALFTTFHNSTEVINLSVKPYMLKEKFGQRDRLFQIQLKICCPLFNEAGERAAFVVTNNCSEHHLRVVN